MKRLILALVLVAVACGGSWKANLVKADQTVEQLLATVDDAERVLCFGTTDVTAIPAAQRGHCTAGTVGLTDTLHQQISKSLSHAYAAQIRLGPILKAAQSGAAVPSDLTAALADAKDIQSLISAATPNAKIGAFLAQVTAWTSALAALMAQFGGTR